MLFEHFVYDCPVVNLFLAVYQTKNYDGNRYKIKVINHRCTVWSQNFFFFF